MMKDPFSTLERNKGKRKKLDEWCTSAHRMSTFEDRYTRRLLVGILLDERICWQFLIDTFRFFKRLSVGGGMTGHTTAEIPPMSAQTCPTSVSPIICTKRTLHNGLTSLVSSKLGGIVPLIL